MTDRRDQALELFAPLGPRYDRLGTLLSFGQDPRWRRAMVSHIPRDGGSVLDVATGTGLVAERLLAGATASPGSTRARTCSLWRGAGSVTASSSSRHRQPSFRSPMPRSTTSRSRTCSGTSTIPAATLAELARVVRLGRDDREPRVLRPPWHLAAAVGPLRRRRPPRARPDRLEGLVRRRPLPRPVDSRVLRAVAARAPARALA